MRFDPKIITGGEAARLRGGRCRRGSTFGRPANPFATSRKFRAFTLIELLVVLAIIGILAGIGIPALKGMGGGLEIDAANRQLVDDLSYARLKAINERTRVYVVFVPPSIVDANWNSLTAEERKELEKLVGLQYRGYAMFTERSLGDQPGRLNPRYISEWRVLPDGTFITPHKCQLSMSESQRMSLDLTNRPFAYFPVNFPLAKSAKPNAGKNAGDVAKYLPCLVFDYQGRLVSPSGGTPTDEYITISKGTVVYPTDANGKYALQPAEVIETPKSNHWHNPAIRVDWLTGRTRMVLPGGTKG